MPQKVPALTAQEAVGEGLTEMEVVLVLEVVVEVLTLEVVVEVEVLEVVVELVVTGTEPPGTRYQLASGSLRQVPAVMPFQPLAAMRPK